MGSGDFLNGAILLCTALNSRELLELLHQVEQEYGRERDGANTPRTLDLDLLVFGREFSEDESLVLPHPRMHERLFVLDPVAILCPDLQLARADQKTVRERQLELRELR
jgi:2-amino-4-hydroxy-6-hydroxymethyldihydropteridine diphosphokinase